MRIEITGHGKLKRLLGDTPCAFELPLESTVIDALNRLAERLPDLAVQLPQTACALGDSLVPRDRILQDGDVLALIPPVSGG